MRELLLTEKSTEIQVLLTEWAMSHSLLKPGERIEFSMRIVDIPLVARSNLRNLNLLVLSPKEFFSKERFRWHDVEKSMIVRIQRAIERASQFKYGKWTRKEWDSENEDTPPVRVHTMRHFLEWYPTEDELSQIRGLGGKSLAIVMEILEPLR